MRRNLNWAFASRARIEDRLYFRGSQPPAVEGDFVHGPGKSLGDIPFHSDTGVYFRQKIEAPWFAYWLHDKGTLPVKEATTFQTGSGAGDYILKSWRSSPIGESSFTSRCR